MLCPYICRTVDNDGRNTVRQLKELFVKTAIMEFSKFSVSVASNKNNCQERGCVIIFMPPTQLQKRTCPSELVQVQFVYFTVHFTVASSIPCYMLCYGDLQQRWAK